MHSTLPLLLHCLHQALFMSGKRCTPWISSSRQHKAQHSRREAALRRILKHVSLRDTHTFDKVFLRVLSIAVGSFMSLLVVWGKIYLPMGKVLWSFIISKCIFTILYSYIPLGSVMLLLVVRESVCLLHQKREKHVIKNPLEFGKNQFGRRWSLRILASSICLPLP